MSASSQKGVQDFQRWELPEVGSVALAVLASDQPTVRELEAIEQQAHAEGHAAGLAQGLVEARQRSDEMVARLEQLFRAAALPLESLDDEVELELARLATLIATQVVGHELRLSPASIVQSVRAAAAALPAATRELRIYMHPDDLALMRELGASEAHWQLHSDSTLSRGDCRMRSEHSRLDARVSTRLAAAIDAVLGPDADLLQAPE